MMCVVTLKSSHSSILTRHGAFKLSSRDARPNRVAKGFLPLASTPPTVRSRSGRFIQEGAHLVRRNDPRADRQRPHRRAQQGRCDPVLRWRCEAWCCIFSRVLNRTKWIAVQSAPYPVHVGGNATKSDIPLFVRYVPPHRPHSQRIPVPGPVSGRGGIAATVDLAGARQS